MSAHFPEPGECGHHTVFDAVKVRTAAGERMQLSLVDMPPGSVIDWHSHPNEQVGMVVAGRATFHVGEEVKELEAGDFYVIPGGVRHKVVTGEEALRALDVFDPVRDEYR